MLFVFVRRRVTPSVNREGYLATTLAEMPTNVVCRIESVGLAVREMGYYVTVGLRRGGLARVLARYPERVPRFVEVEVGSQIISLPMNLAVEVVVQPCS